MRNIPEAEAIRNRHKDLLPEPMFEVAPATQQSIQKPRSRRKVGEGTCPICGRKSLSLYRDRARDGRRILILRNHERVTYGGVRWPCKGSGQEP